MSGRTVVVPSGRAAGATRCRKKFLRFFPQQITDETYLDWERDYKWAAHERWESMLGKRQFARMLKSGAHAEIAASAVRVESATNLLFSFEKMALRDAVKSKSGARIFAEGLFNYLHGRGGMQRRFERWVEAVGQLPRRQTRVLTWPVVTVFGMIARPDEHIFLKPNVTRVAAREYGFDLAYASRPNWDSYASLLAFAARIRGDLGATMAPRDMIDVQSFIWVQGSDEYEE